MWATCSWQGLELEVKVLDKDQTSSPPVVMEGEQSPTGAAAGYRHEVVFAAVRGFRHRVIFGSLVPPRPLSQRRFDDLGRIVVSVVGRT